VLDYRILVTPTSQCGGLILLYRIGDKLVKTTEGSIEHSNISSSCEDPFIRIASAGVGDLTNILSMSIPSSLSALGSC